MNNGWANNAAGYGWGWGQPYHDGRVWVWPGPGVWWWWNERLGQWLYGGGARTGGGGAAGGGLVGAGAFGGSAGGGGSVTSGTGVSAGTGGGSGNGGGGAGGGGGSSGPPTNATAQPHTQQHPQQPSNSSHNANPPQNPNQPSHANPNPNSTSHPHTAQPQQSQPQAAPASTSVASLIHPIAPHIHASFIASTSYTATTQRSQVVVLDVLQIATPLTDARLLPLSNPFIHTSVTADYFEAQSLSESFYTAGTPRLPQFEFVGFDCEFETITGGHQRAALIQVGAQRPQRYEVNINQVALMRRIPSTLRDLIEDRRVIKLVLGGSADVTAIQHWATGQTANVSRARGGQRPGLSDLTRMFLGFSMAGPERGQSWGDRDQSYPRLVYACLDPWATEMAFRAIYARLEAETDTATANKILQQCIMEAMNQRWGGFEV
ncbi:hypothetical protein HDV00_008232 [Rhizophlyctis rosea]|nr:hypothetical protein HDV00_008232 [Rhizophlyctis rosea]